VVIGRNVWISQQVYLDELYPEAISIGDNSTIGLRSSIIAHLHWGRRRDSGGYKPVVIEADVFIGPHTVILPGVRVGRGSVIKAGSVLTRSVPPGVMWGCGEGRFLARVGTPLTPQHSYEDFCRNLKPMQHSRSTAHKAEESI
jgi:tetrahydrodipicolinate N-succinyltransferase